MITAAREHRRVVQTGIMQRSSVEFRFATDLGQAGRLGTIPAVNVTLPGPNGIDRAGSPVPDSSPPRADSEDPDTLGRTA